MVEKTKMFNHAIFGSITEAENTMLVGMDTSLGALKEITMSSVFGAIKKSLSPKLTRLAVAFLSDGGDPALLKGIESDIVSARSAHIEEVNRLKSLFLDVAKLGFFGTIWPHAKFCLDTLSKEGVDAKTFDCGSFNCRISPVKGIKGFISIRLAEFDIKADQNPVDISQIATNAAIAGKIISTLPKLDDIGKIVKVDTSATDD